MRKSWPLSAKLGAVGGALFVLVLALIALTLWVSWQLEGGAAAVNEAGRMRMQTWRMAQTLGGGEIQRLDEQARRFDDSLALLRSGDPSRPLFVPYDEATRTALARVQQDWSALRARWLAQRAPAAGATAAEAERFVRQIDVFVHAIELQLARWGAILNLFQFGLMLLAIGAAVALLYAAYLFVFDPLARLQAALARVEAGDLGARVEVAAGDEFGALAAGFNRMGETLQRLYQGLEATVVEKTERLRAERQRLAALHEAGAFVARAASLDELAHGFARQLRQVAHADAAAVRWSDEDNRRYLLAGHDCLPQEMVRSGSCVHTGSCLCGQPQAQARSQVFPIRGDTRLGHCRMAGFEQMLSVPVRLHDRVLGEVELFYRGAATPGAEDRALIDTLASHLAGAVESQRAAALEREAAVSEERGLLARELHDSIAQGLAFLKIQVQLLRDARRQGDAAKVERALGELEAGVRESTADVRELLLHFRTRTNGEDITPALQTTLRKFEHQTGLATYLEVQGEGLPLAPDEQVQVLHVVQEALSNVRKHAGASQVWVQVQQAPGFSVQVRDDGSGFASEQPASDETHVGLRIMRERAARIGARVEVVSAPGSGTRVQLSLQRPGAADRAAALP
jgi:two-component system nitrate/nitrite sensor histidine kinase NarX